MEYFDMNDLVEIVMENGKTMKIALASKVAPISVANFKKLISEGYYDGLIFHRVIKGFMIQGGGYDQNFKSKRSEEIKGEFTANGINNPILHERGVLSMARTMVNDSATSQFFIMHKDSPHLDGQYAAFGKVIEGLDVIDEIAKVRTNFQDCPLEPQIIKTIRFVK